VFGDELGVEVSDDRPYLAYSGDMDWVWILIILEVGNKGGGWEV